MSTINRKRSADMPSLSSGNKRHPCFWGLLYGEELSFAFLSTALSNYLGTEKSASMSSQSLFDYIHPDEVSRARSDLVDTFISKSFVGSNIRCRLRRFDLARAEPLPFFRRASESQIIHNRHQHARSVFESMERKLSLPLIPDIANMYITKDQGYNSPRVSGSHHGTAKRLRTILEDSSTSGTPGDCSFDNANDSDYLIANITLYPVSKRLSIMVCHFEDSENSQSSISPHPQCECLLSSSEDKEIDRVCRLLPLELQKLKHTAMLLPEFSYSFLGSRSAALPGVTGIEIAPTRHIQIYSVKTMGLLYAFPEEGYSEIAGETPSHSVRRGTTLDYLWTENDPNNIGKTVADLLERPPTSTSDPIRLEVQIHNRENDTTVNAESVVFRWGCLLFVCQQLQNDGPEYNGTVGDAVLSNYNLSTPPSDDSARTEQPNAILSSYLVTQNVNTSGSQMVTRPATSAPMANAASPTNMVLNQNQTLGTACSMAPSDSQPFSISRAPASVAASLTIRPGFMLTPPEAVPPRRQSSYTLPPTKPIEERRFSYPTQYINKVRKLQMPLGGSPSSTSASSPGTRAFDMRQSLQIQQQTQPKSKFQKHSIITGYPRIATMPKNDGPSQPTPRPSPPNTNTPIQPTISTLQSQHLHLQNQTGLSHVQVNIYPPQSQESSDVWVQPQTQLQIQTQVQKYTQPTQSPSTMGTWKQQQQPTSGNSVSNTHALSNSVSPYTSQLHHSPALVSGASPSTPMLYIHRGDERHPAQGRPFHEPEKKTCKSCGTDTSPEWRKGPSGHKTLCNACGLRYARSISRANKKLTS